MMIDATCFFTRTDDTFDHMLSHDAEALRSGASHSNVALPSEDSGSRLNVVLVVIRRRLSDVLHKEHGEPLTGCLQSARPLMPLSEEQRSPCTIF